MRYRGNFIVIQVLLNYCLANSCAHYLHIESQSQMKDESFYHFLATRDDLINPKKRSVTKTDFLVFHEQIFSCPVHFSNAKNFKCKNRVIFIAIIVDADGDCPAKDHAWPEKVEATWFIKTELVISYHAN